MSTSTGFQRVVQLFWDKDLENNDDINPIVVLGRSYTLHLHRGSQINDLPPESFPTEETDQQGEQEESDAFHDFKQYFQRLKITQQQSTTKPLHWPDDFLNDVYTRIWFTYRTKFPPIPRDPDGPSPLTIQNIIRGQTNDLNNDHFTTDCGWGCMIRTGQTLLANALLDLRLGRDYRFELNRENEFSSLHNEIISLFIDDPVYPFSIHNIVEKGKILSGKKAGEWFGPSATARSIQALCSENEDKLDLKVYIGADIGDIYEKDFFKSALNEDGVFKPTLILLGVRLGVDNINSIYWSSLKDLLGFSQSVGISGGRPSSSHYFFGYQGDYLFYLDPHVPQPSLKSVPNELSQIDANTLAIETVHTKKLRKIHISEVDPSMLIGVLIKDEDDWWDFKEKIQKIDHKNKIVHISPDQSPDDPTSRKPSFVVLENDSDDFIDVGLEYDELKEEEEIETGDLVTQIEDTDDVVTVQKKDRKEEDLGSSTEDDKKESLVPVYAEEIPIDKSLVMVDETKVHVDSVFVDNEDAESLTSPQKLELSQASGSFENCTNSIKDDYENISTVISNEKLQEDPCVIDKDELDKEENDWENDEFDEETSPGAEEQRGDYQENSTVKQD